jgi:hypothetical protein
VEGKLVISFLVSLVLSILRHSLVATELWSPLCSKFFRLPAPQPLFHLLQSPETSNSRRGKQGTPHPPVPAASGDAAADAHAAGARCGGGAPGGRHHHRADPKGTSRPHAFFAVPWLSPPAASARFAKKRTSTSPPRSDGYCACRAFSWAFSAARRRLIHLALAPHGGVVFRDWFQSKIGSFRLFG